MSGNRGRLRSCWWLVVLAGLLGSCTVLPQEDSPVPIEKRWIDTSGDAAVAVGELTISDGCLILLSEDGDTGVGEVNLVWPSRWTTYRDDQVVFTFPFAWSEPLALSPGDRVAIAGGSERRALNEVDWLWLPPDCADRPGEWVTVGYVSLEEQ